MNEMNPPLGDKTSRLPSPRTPFKRSSSSARRFLEGILLILLVVSLHLIGREQLDQTNGKHSRILVGREAENLFLTIPTETSAIKASRQYALKPHLAGSPGDLVTATIFLGLLQRELGIDSDDVSTFPFPAGSPQSRNATLSIPELDAPRAWIDIYYPVMNTPLDRSLEILGDGSQVIWKADLEEYSDDTDKEASEYSDSVPTFHGLSPGGTVQGKPVFANYGRKEDYDALIANGVSLNGTIVIARYGGIFRGLKVKGAQELGAVGVLIYSDPRDDGTVTTENGYAPYPHGPARNPTSVQRGSVQFLSVYPGDPTTPGYPSYENSTRTNGTNIPTIPSLPISWANAEVLLKAVKGGAWEGKQIKLVNHVDTKVTPIWNTLAVIPGHIKDEVVVVGNHRDAWVMGATDPSSGTASIHEVVRGFGELMKNGWRPLRTILIASWDAEEYGLIGSTEWGEDFHDWINEHVVAYVNLDSSVSGSRFRASGSPLLAHLIRNAAHEIPHPTSPGRTLWDATRDNGTLFGERADGQSFIDPEAAAIYNRETIASNYLGISPLGSGSDYTVFLQRNGIASSNGGFGSTLHDPVYHYHSVFDSERWQELYGDPGFFRHVAVAKHLGLQVLRLSSSIVLPFNTTYYSGELKRYLETVEIIALTQGLPLDLSPLRESIRTLEVASAGLDVEKHEAEDDLLSLIKKWKKHNSRWSLKKKLLKIYCRLRKVLRHPCKHSLQMRIGRFSDLLREQCLDDSLAYGFALEAGYDGGYNPFYTGSSTNLPSHFPIHKFKRAVKRVQAANKKLRAFERGFISEDGIKDREWYKHLGVAPGKWLGYGATTFPGLTEAILFEKNVTLAMYETSRLKDLIEKLEGEIRVDA